MNSLCWEGIGKSVDHDAVVRVVGGPMILVGIWALNVVIVTFALPVLGFSRLRKAMRPRRMKPGLAASRPVHS